MPSQEEKAASQIPSSTVIEENICTPFFLIVLRDESKIGKQPKCQPMMNESSFVIYNRLLSNCYKGQNNSFFLLHKWNKLTSC